MATKKEQLFKKYSIFDIASLQNAWKNREEDIKLDRTEFIEWHGTSSIARVVEEDIIDILNGDNDNFRLEAKIISGELEKYPFEDRTTNDGYVSIDRIYFNDGIFSSGLDQYHSHFLKIGSEFRVIAIRGLANNIEYKES